MGKGYGLNHIYVKEDDWFNAEVLEHVNDQGHTIPSHPHFANPFMATNIVTNGDGYGLAVQAVSKNRLFKNKPFTLKGKQFKMRKMKG